MNWASRLIRLPLRLVPKTATVRILLGRLSGARWITGASTHGCWLGTYEPEAQRVFAQFVNDGDVIYDIGANVGFFTLLAARLAGAQGAVYAFEPMPRNLTFLRKNIELNGAENIRVFPVAVSARAGHARFGMASGPSMAHLDEAGELEVETVSIDGLIAAKKLRDPQFIKIDVEGAELEVLTGAEATLRRSRPVVLLSNHGYQRHEQCCAYLSRLDYELETVRDGRADGQYTVVAVHSGK